MCEAIALSVPATLLMTLCQSVYLCVVNVFLSGSPSGPLMFALLKKPITAL